MPPISTAIRLELVAELAEAGIVATLDPAAVPPFVLVGPGDLLRVGRGGLSNAVAVTVAVAPPGDERAQRWLEATAEAVLLALRGTEPATHTTYMLGDQACPAYTMTITRTHPAPCP